MPKLDPARLALKWVCVSLLIGGLVILAWFSLHLAAIGIFQMEECRNVSAASVLADGRAKILGVSFDLFQYLLSFVCQGSAHSIDLFISARLLMYLVFWLNIILLGVATGERLGSVRWLVALAGAATLSPLWRYGFEARTDNLVLTGILLTWCALRVGSGSKLAGFVLAGCLAVILQFLAFRSCVYTLLIPGAVLVFPRTGATARWKLALGWLAAACLTFLAIRMFHISAGPWVSYLEEGKATSHSAYDRAPWAIVAGLSLQIPLLLALCVAAIGNIAANASGRDQQLLSWNGYLPEACLLIVSMIVLCSNLTSFPYDLIQVVPFAFLLAFRYAMALLGEIQNRGALIPVLLAVLIFGHVVPFTRSASHDNRLNYRQERLMRLAEDVTDQVKDPVFDGVGMVPVRSSVNPQTFLSSLNSKGIGEQMRDILAANPPAVIIPNSLTDELPVPFHDLIRERYVSLADDFWVLGKVLSPGGGTFEIYHPGRYRISTLKGSDLAGTYPLGMKGAMTPEDAGTLSASLDGVRLENRPVELSAGAHHLECAPDCQPAAVWMGPRLDRVHRIDPGDHRSLF